MYWYLTTVNPLESPNVPWRLRLPCSESIDLSTDLSHEAILTAAACRVDLAGTFLSPYMFTEPGYNSMYLTCLRYESPRYSMSSMHSRKGTQPFGFAEDGQEDPADPLDPDAAPPAVPPLSYSAEYSGGLMYFLDFPGFLGFIPAIF